MARIFLGDRQIGEMRIRNALNIDFDAASWNLTQEA